MRIITGEFWGNGGIGIIYYDTLGKILTIALLGGILLLATIGLLCVILWFKQRKKTSDEDPGKKWLRTGKM